MESMPYSWRMMGLTKRQPMVVSWISDWRWKALSALPMTKGARVMLSDPPATIRSASPVLMARAAMPTASMPEPHSRLSVTPPELSGATFTVSNLGMYGIKRFVAVADAYELTTRAAAAAEANRKIAESLTEALIAYTYAENWNGELPTFMTGDGATLPMFDMSALLNGTADNGTTAAQPAE